MWKSLDSVLESAIEAETVPGLGLSIIQGQEVLYSKVIGHAQITPQKKDIHSDTLWDLASLTKVLCTAPLLLTLHDQNHIDVFKPLTQLGHSFLADLLSHSSGP